MKNLIPLKKIAIKIQILTAMCFMPPLFSFSQTALNSNGGNNITGSFAFDYSIGEISIQTVNSANLILTQGYLQPFVQLISLQPLFLKQVNNLLSPNGDGKNDVLAFTGLEIYPKNKLSIIDRAGRIVFTASPYNNDFNGIINGKSLAEDTYYFLFEEGELKLKGFFSLVHDKY